MHPFLATGAASDVGIDLPASARSVPVERNPACRRICCSTMLRSRSTQATCTSSNRTIAKAFLKVKYRLFTKMALKELAEPPSRGVLRTWRSVHIGFASLAMYLPVPCLDLDKSNPEHCLEYTAPPAQRVNLPPDVSRREDMERRTSLLAPCRLFSSPKSTESAPRPRRNPSQIREPCCPDRRMLHSPRTAHLGRPATLRA